MGWIGAACRAVNWTGADCRAAEFVTDTVVVVTAAAGFMAASWITAN